MPSGVAGYRYLPEHKLRFLDSNREQPLIPGRCIQDYAQFGFQFRPSEQESMSGEMGGSAANVHCKNPEPLMSLVGHQLPL
jgi:hypothetical protein